MTKPWIAQQEWDHLLFLHWPVPVEVVRPYIPKCFEIDTYDGDAWITIVLFEMNRIKLRGMPDISSLDGILELNVRTYVTFRGDPGVYFLSLDADHSLGVTIARYLLGMNYIKGKMRLDRKGGVIHFSSRRTHQGYPSAHFHARYQPTSRVLTPEPESLLYWLTERYAQWVYRWNKVYKGAIRHQPWTLQKANVEIPVNTLTDYFPSIIFEKKLIAYYSEHKHAKILPFERIR